VTVIALLLPLPLGLLSAEYMLALIGAAAHIH
jgi:hypothetical protein